MEILTGRNTLAVIAVAIGGLGISGCGPNYHTEKQSQVPTYTPNKLVVGVLSGASDNELIYSCDGANLKIQDKGEGNTEVYLNDSACDDRKFTLDDIQIKP